MQTEGGRKQELRGDDQESGSPGCISPAADLKRCDPLCGNVQRNQASSLGWGGGGANLAASAASGRAERWRGSDSLCVAPSLRQGEKKKKAVLLKQATSLPVCDISGM